MRLVPPTGPAVRVLLLRGAMGQILLRLLRLQRRVRAVQQLGKLVRVALRCARGREEEGTGAHARQSAGVKGSAARMPAPLLTHPHVRPSGPPHPARELWLLLHAHQDAQHRPLLVPGEVLWVEGRVGEQANGWVASVESAGRSGRWCRERQRFCQLSTLEPGT